MPKTIIILTATTQYDVADSFIRGLASGFESLGYHVVIADRSHPDFGEQIITILQNEEVYCFFAFGYGGFDLTNDSISFYDKTGIPLFTFLIDNPLYIKAITQGAWNNGIKNHIISCVDLGHAEFLNPYMDNSLVTFIPHAADAPPDKAKLKPIAERSIDVLFPGSYMNPDKIRTEWQNTSLKPILDDITEIALSSDLSLLAITESYLTTKGILLREVSDNALFWQLISKVDQFVRYRFRHDIVTKLVQDGVYLHIYGNGWDEFAGKSNIFPGTDFETIKTLMLDSKAVLTVLISFTHGLHERILEAMAHGAVSVTDSNSYIDSCFKHNQHLVSYSKRDFSHLPAELSRLLGNATEAQRIADCGYDAVKQYHTWKHRAATILNSIEIHNNKGTDIDYKIPY